MLISVSSLQGFGKRWLSMFSDKMNSGKWIYDPLTCLYHRKIIITGVSCWTLVKKKTFLLTDSGNVVSQILKKIVSFAVTV